MTEVIANDYTPNRKRKRNSEKSLDIAPSAFINAAFTNSTPKRIFGKRRLIPGGINVKENKKPYGSNTCMEIKSIAELIQQKQDEKSNVETKPPCNPYEVQRKPPKKKKREIAIEESCFENPALNLNMPEKQFNPYEVQREIINTQANQSKCFVNNALNIKGQDSELVLQNPFEVKRIDLNENDFNGNIKFTGVENLALENANCHSNIKIGVPFTPTVGCRIDFNNISLTRLTPSKLLFAEKLVFSPVPCPIILPKRSLEAISEESSTMSIGKELDRYQLELENSINEAKVLKNGDDNLICENTEEEHVYQIQVKIDKRVSLTPNLANIVENDESENEQKDEYNNMNKGINILYHQNQSKKSLPINEPHSILNTRLRNVIDPKSDFISNLDLKTSASLARAYSLDVDPKGESQESINLETSSKSSSEYVADHKVSKGVKKNLCQSMRKIIHTDLIRSQQQTEKNCELQSNTNSHSDQEYLEDTEYKATVPFVRSYRRDMDLKTGNKESIYSKYPTKSECVPDQKDSKDVKNFLRKSMRKLIHPNPNHSHHNTGKNIESNANTNDDIAFDSDQGDADDTDFRAPAPFVRTYRRDVQSNIDSKEFLNSEKNTQSSTECITDHKDSKGVKNFFRKSMRKLINHDSNHNIDRKAESESDIVKGDGGQWSHILSNVRQSLRRKPKTKEEYGNIEDEVPLSEISIIDTGERKIKLKSSIPQNEYMRIEDLTNERKHFLGQGSLRRSTREVKQKLMSTLFQQKHEDYVFKK